MKSIVYNEVCCCISSITKHQIGELIWHQMKLEIYKAFPPRLILQSICGALFLAKARLRFLSTSSNFTARTKAFRQVATPGSVRTLRGAFRSARPVEPEPASTGGGKGGDHHRTAPGFPLLFACTNRRRLRRGRNCRHFSMDCSVPRPVHSCCRCGRIAQFRHMDAAA